ncbi:MAG: DUF1684 domain-containing protein [Meiothermus sp.]|nr:DUF1684 domain-containing protein [Meiothermus sp.]
MTASPETYLAELETFRQQRASAIGAANSWLALAGLFWLEEGENSLGSSADCAVVLPGLAPRIGALWLEGESVRLESSIPVEIDGQPQTQAELHSDKSGKPTRVNIGELSFIVLRRGTHHAVRLWDNHNAGRTATLDWFAPDPAFRVEATFVAEPRTLEIGLSTGFEILEYSPSPGYVRFSLGGQEHRLVAQSAEPEKRLFFNFKDPTNASQTYGAGRFLTTDGVKDGKVTLDFNYATNPYCAYTDHATCPLPPAENRLSVAVVAGEKRYNHG